MKLVKGWYVPDFDQQFEHLITPEGTYQYPNLIAAVSHCKQLRTVIDGGAHIGTWSRVFAAFFDRGSRYAAKGGDVERISVDSLALQDLDLLKMDIEGSEVHALMGARKTLIRCQPIVLFESKNEWRRHGFSETAPHDFLASLGAVKLDHVGIDEIWGWV